MSEADIQNASWQLRRCDNPWKPNMHHGQSEVYRRMLGILNRVTEQSMHILLEQALELPIMDHEHMPSILSLLLTKSQDEPLFVPIYAHLCSELAQRINIQDALRAACEEHFMDSLQRLLEFEGIFQDSVTMELIQQEILTRKRLAVHMGFVCELERKGIVPTSQLVNMMETLQSNDDLRSVECLCRLLSYAGVKLTEARQDIVGRCCADLQNLLNSDALPPRMRFLIQDTLELKANGWRPRARGIVTFSGRNVRG